MFGLIDLFICTAPAVFALVLEKVLFFGTYKSTKNQYAKSLLVCDTLPQSLCLVRKVLFASRSVSKVSTWVYLEETFASESYTLVVSHKGASWLSVLVKLEANKT